MPDGELAARLAAQPAERAAEKLATEGGGIRDARREKQGWIEKGSAAARLRPRDPSQDNLGHAEDLPKQPECIRKTGIR